MNAAHVNDPHKGEDKKSHCHRAHVFVEWLLTTFGMDLLQQGCVDIAGGRGDLGFELSVKRGLPCTVVDPRCGGEELQPSAWIDWQLSRTQRQWLEQNRQGVKGIEQCKAIVAASPLRRCNAVLKEDWREDRERWEKVVQGGKLIIAMHPDEATGGAVDLACAFGLPFAVVPCCVFSDLFPFRVFSDGRRVRTHEELVEWLRLRSQGQVEFLGFRGKNVVVFNSVGFRNHHVLNEFATGHENGSLENGSELSDGLVCSPCEDV